MRRAWRNSSHWRHRLGWTTAPRAEVSLTKSSTRTPEEFQRFLSWLDEGVDSGGERYVEMRRRLVSYFGRKLCLLPDELADETLIRVARKLEEQGSITDSPPARYCYIVARFVFLEYLRGADQRRASLDDRHAATDPVVQSAASEETDRASDEALLDGLDQCLQQLDEYDRALILEYYAGEQAERIERRRTLAARLNLTLNALTIRACRIRDRLEKCLDAPSSGT
jgi:DNA-directed RNA polymerase specialized sigma24 family protein